VKQFVGVGWDFTFGISNLKGGLLAYAASC
jgi:hypothetical protein